MNRGRYAEVAMRAGPRQTEGMRLFLSSFRPSDQSRELSDLAGVGTKAAVLLNALDNLPDFPRGEWFEGERRTLAALGLPAEELDLRAFVGRLEESRGALAEVGLVWVTGGNVFVLRDAMRRSGFDVALRERLSEDSLVYGGYSAGACVAGPTLHGLELVDDASAVAAPTWDGLRLVDFSVVPHHASDHGQSARVEHVITYLRQRAMPYRALRDGEALIVSDGRVMLVGEPRTV
ncbi:MAG: peptidase E [Actinobacteria bacterium]|nr:peptidase E [Actinomycetota bacterium]